MRILPKEVVLAEMGRRVSGLSRFDADDAPSSFIADSWANCLLGSLPFGARNAVRREYLKMRNAPHATPNFMDDRWPKANHYLHDLCVRIDRLPLPLSAGDGEIIKYAERQAKNSKELAIDGFPLSVRLAYASTLGINTDNIKFKTDEGLSQRLMCSKFWRRRLRKGLGREIESINRNELGLVSKFRQPYVSNDTLDARRSQRRRNRQMMECVEVINDLGQSFTLIDLVERSVSNPAIRRAELMARISGFERIAIECEHAGEFITLTCPSKYHARRVSGRRNPKFAGFAPDEGARYLSRVWARILTELSRNNIKVYGFRVAEPHHDGTPHWHGLFFMPKDQVQKFRQIVAKHAVREEKEELRLHYCMTQKEAKLKAKNKQESLRASGAKVPSLDSLLQTIKTEVSFWSCPPKGAFDLVRARVDFKAIDWSRGSAAGYIAKYIAKNIDGQNVHGETIGLDYEVEGRLTAAESAERVDAWASRWGIRQFQQIGGAPVTIWRELRGWDYAADGAEDVLLRASIAADIGDWGRFVEVMGGYAKSRKDQPLKLHRDPTEELNMYQEPCDNVLRGVVDVATGELAITRKMVWKMVWGGSLGGAAAPWTCVNNSTKNQIRKPQELTAESFEGVLLENDDFSIFDINEPDFSMDGYADLVQMNIESTLRDDYGQVSRLLKDFRQSTKDHSRGLEVIADVKAGYIPFEWGKPLTKPTRFSDLPAGKSSRLDYKKPASLIDQIIKSKRVLREQAAFSDMANSMQELLF